MKLYEHFKAALRSATPLVGVSSYDPAQTIEDLVKLIPDDYNIIEWDCVRGYAVRKGEIAIEKREFSANPIEALVIAESFPAKTVVFMINGQLFSKPASAQPGFIQALWNLRDQYKLNNRMITIVGQQVQMPLELQQDVVTFDEELPSPEALRSMIQTLLDDNDVPYDDNALDAATDALLGLAQFPAEQATAMCMTKEGLNIEGLWERKRQLINDTPGLSVWNGGQKFDDLGGLEGIKTRFKRILAGRKPPRVVVWLDEVEKAMSGSDSGGGDSSGTSQDQLGVLLSEMQDKEYSGAMLVGIPGAAKSAFAKAVANEAGVLTIRFDLGEMKGSLVGQSEERIRHAMKVVEAVGGHGGAFFIATSNDIRAIRPELKRRFKRGIYFFDTPTDGEKLKIWEIHLNRFFPAQAKEMMKKRPVDMEWTGAEIEACVQIAWEEDIPLTEAAKSIIPVTVSAAQEVERLRNEADGRYSSTSFDGPYKRIKPEEDNKPKRRKIEL